MIKNSLVVDTNLIFSALISKSSKIRETLFESKFVFYSPNFLITEIFTHKEKLLKSSKLNEEEFYLYLNGIIECITFVPIDFIGKESRQIAFDLCKNIDIKDTPFIALAIELDIPIWTGDKKLKTGLKIKGFNSFYIE
jgi:predicted nucleic acid-binding protein